VSWERCLPFAEEKGPCLGTEKRNAGKKEVKVYQREEGRRSRGVKKKKTGFRPPKKGAGPLKGKECRCRAG